MVVNMKIMTM